MNLDDSNDVFPSSHHKEARNGVFKGNIPDMHFTAIRGNQKVTNDNLFKNDCNIFGNITFTPNCNLVGTATLVTAVNYNIVSSCDGTLQDITINSITGGNGTYQATETTYTTEFAALNGTFVNVVDGAKVYENQPGTSLRYVAVRDTSGVAPIVKSINANCTTASPTTEPTTLPPNQEWYYIYDCATGSITTSTSYAQGTFTVNQSVTSPVTQKNYYIQSVSPTVLPSPNYPIQSIGGTGCQDVTTQPTTLPTVSYTFTTNCPAGPGSGQIIVSNVDGGTYLNYYARIISIANSQLMFTQGPFNQGSGVTFSNLPDSNYILTVGNGTSFANGSTKYPNIGCGTTLAPTTTEPPPTTTPAPVNFGGSSGCANGGQSDGQITILSFSGGYGTYDATPANTTYSTEFAALNGNFSNVEFTRTYTGLADGTYWVALRDRTNTFNKIAKSFTVGVCPTTTEVVLPEITASASSVCTSSGTQNIIVNNFAGGDGTNYYASTTTYLDAGAAGSGPVSSTPASSYTYNNQQNGTRFIKLVSGNRITIKQIGQTFNFNANYSELVGYIYTCNGGVTSTPVKRNTNTCFFGNQWESNNITYATNPSQEAPNTNPVWVNMDINSYWDCVDVNKYYRQINTNPCYSGYQYQTGGIYEPNSPDCGYVAPTTAPPTLATVNYTISSVCDGTLQDITISNFTGGNGSYERSTQTYANGSDVFSGAFTAVSGSYTYENQPGNETRYVGLRNTVGGSPIVKSINAGCTTQAPTTEAPPTTQQYDIYSLIEYECVNGTCEETGATVYGAFPVGATYNQLRFYKPTTPNGRAYKVSNRFQSGSPYLVMNTVSGTVCEIVAGC